MRVAHNKSTKEEVLAICKEKNITYVDKYYNRDKQKSFIKFICNIHQDKGVQEKCFIDVKKQKKACPYCNHSKLKETFRDEMKEINNKITFLSEYINWNTKIKCKCNDCGNEWDGLPSTLLSGGGCKPCGQKRAWDVRGRKTTEIFIEEMSFVNKDILVVGEYKGSHKLIKCKCLIDGCEWESYAANLLNSSAGCPSCTSRKMSESQSFTDEEFRKKIYEITDGNITPIGEYVSANTKMEFLCNKHNVKYIQMPSKLLYGNSRGCISCSQSVGENMMLKALSSLGINYKTQHIIPDCKHKNPLRFDAFDTENNIAFEYNGRQHYEPVNFGGCSDEVARLEYNNTVLRDNIKYEYCKNNNIRLIIIPHWVENIKLFISKELGL